MWEQYKKSFWGMQLVIALVTIAAFFRVFAHQVLPALEFYGMLQVAAVFGSRMGTRLKKWNGSHG
jgi:hypothetical protein